MWEPLELLFSTCKSSQELERGNIIGSGVFRFGETATRLNFNND